MIVTRILFPNILRNWKFKQLPRFGGADQLISGIDRGGEGFMNRYICDSCGEEFDEWPYYFFKTEGKIFCSGRLAEFLREFAPEFFRVGRNKNV